MPGIFVQNAIFGSTSTAIGLAEDLKKGIIDRFRSLPMARSAVLIGRTTADLVKNFLLVVVMVVVGYLVGFRFRRACSTPSVSWCSSMAVGFTFSWVSASIGLAIKQVEAVQAAIFTLIFPIVFVSAAFVPVTGMAAFLQPIAEHEPRDVLVQPGSILVDRRGRPRRDPGTSWTAQQVIIGSFVWIVGPARDLRPAVDPALPQADLTRREHPPAHPRFHP